MRWQAGQNAQDHRLQGPFQPLKCVGFQARHDERASNVLHLQSDNRIRQTLTRQVHPKTWHQVLFEALPRLSHILRDVHYIWNLQVHDACSYSWLRWRCFSNQAEPAYIQAYSYQAAMLCLLDPFQLQTGPWCRNLRQWTCFQSFVQALRDRDAPYQDQKVPDRWCRLKVQARKKRKDLIRWEYCLQ